MDVGLERNGAKVACDISVTTNNEHELKNIDKCLRSGYQKILLCVPEKKRIETLRKLIVEKLDPTHIDRIFLVQPDELFLFFEQETPKETMQNTELRLKRN